MGSEFSILKDLRALSNPEIAKISQRFFKTGPGEYGEGDVFLGIRVPELRKLSKKYRDISLSDIKQLITSIHHEKRLLALFILVYQFKSSTPDGQYQRFKFYLDYLEYINNWDLIDGSVQHIVGAYLLDKPKDLLVKWAKSDNLWKRRMAIMATFYYIKIQQFQDTLKIAEILVLDTHDLIQKAVGWMLREVGNRDIEIEEKFLKKYYKKMPRTMLRYAIEKFPENKRQRYLKGTV